MKKEKEEEEDATQQRAAPSAPMWRRCRALPPAACRLLS